MQGGELMGAEILTTGIKGSKRLHVHQRFRWDGEEGTQWLLFLSLWMRQDCRR